MLGIFPLPWTPLAFSPRLQEWEAAAQFHRQGGIHPCPSQAGWVWEKLVPRQAEGWSWGACPRQRLGAAPSVVLARLLLRREANAKGISTEHEPGEPLVAACTLCVPVSRDGVALQRGGIALGSGLLLSGRQSNFGSCFAAGNFSQ